MIGQPYPTRVYTQLQTGMDPKAQIAFLNSTPGITPGHVDRITLDADVLVGGRPRQVGAAGILVGGGVILQYCRREIALRVTAENVNLVV